MSARIPADDIEVYAATVRAELADLPPIDRDTLLEDLEQHLAEVIAEGGGTLAERLGPPEQYGRELRAAYHAVQPNATRRDIHPSQTLQRAIAWLTGSHTYQQIRDFLPSLRPAWWVLRAYLAVLILTAALSPGSNLGPLPSLFTKRGWAEIIATAVAIWLSVRLGRRRQPIPQPARAAFASLNVLVAFIAIIILGGMRTFPYVSVIGSSVQQQRSFSTAFADGPVTNIYAYTQDGKPLTNVLLYDQDGQPLMVQKGEPTTSYTIGADGKAITNAYPLTQRHQNGDPVAAPRVALPPWPSATAGASPSPSPSPSVSPTR